MDGREARQALLPARPPRHRGTPRRGQGHHRRRHQRRTHHQRGPARPGHEPQEVLTSLDRLAAATGRDVDDVRLALAELAQSGDAQVYCGQEPAVVERLEAHRRFRLVMEWEHFHQTRMQLSIPGDDV
ncbi:DUF6042 family protein [Streptomyces albogriseolus]|uniref:DUF6042 family protein n=1 Tax=Streptomyces albogriseolus TaxID=1887 RepID=UPI0034613804|nr:DUF6042 family protein [Streptomyces albogriseolus]